MAQPDGEISSNDKHILKINQESHDSEWLKGTSAEKMIKTNTHKSNSMKNDFSHPIYKKISKINGDINKMSIKDLVNTLETLNLNATGKKEVLQKRLKSHYKMINLKSADLNSSAQKLVDEVPSCSSTGTNVASLNFKCKFDYVCVIDFEATCTENKIADYPHEIIQFPVVLINMKTFQVVRLS
jgi:3'-5' exoribonuclease 1